MSIIELDVKKTLNKVPLDGVEGLIISCKMVDGSTQAVKTDNIDEDEAVEILEEVIEMYDGDGQIVFEGDFNDNQVD